MPPFGIWLLNPFGYCVAKRASHVAKTEDLILLIQPLCGICSLKLEAEAELSHRSTGSPQAISSPLPTCNALEDSAPPRLSMLNVKKAKNVTIDCRPKREESVHFTDVLMH